MSPEVNSVLLGLLSGSLGILWSAWQNAARASRGKFDFTTWVVENGNGIALSFAGIILGVTITAVVPGAVEITPALELPKAGNIAAWFTTGIALYSRTRKIGNRKTKK